MEQEEEEEGQEEEQKRASPTPEHNYSPEIELFGHRSPPVFQKGSRKGVNHSVELFEQ